MGQILLAQVVGSQGFKRKMVLKGLLPELEDDEISAALFQREARLMARLEHPNIVRVFDVPEIDSAPYLAMEYVRGRNFHQVIQKTLDRGAPIPVRFAAHIVAQSLRGLHFAHTARDQRGGRMGIVHRDVSPGNVLLSYYGEVKVTDFGIAKMIDTPNITGPRAIRGKMRYVAPELIRGRTATPASDVYSAGVVLAEAFSGRALWRRETIAQTLLDITTEDREHTVDRIFEGLHEPRGARRILQRALAIDPDDRYGSAIEAAEALDGLSLDNGGPVTQAAVGAYLRRLFDDAPDVPDEATLASRASLGGAPVLELGTRDALVSGPASQVAKDTVQIRPRAPAPPPKPAARFEPEGVSYLSELNRVSTDEEVARPLPRESNIDRIETALSGWPPWVLVITGILIGAFTAIGGSLIAVITAG